MSSISSTLENLKRADNQAYENQVAIWEFALKLKTPLMVNDAV